MTNLLLFILIIQIIHFLGTWKLYVKAGRKAWEAAVPVYNAYVLTKIMNRPWWWVILLFIPIVNLMMFPAFWVETVRSYGKEDTKEVLLAVFTLGFYIYYLNYIEIDNIEYQEERQLSPKTKLGEWVTSIVFAVIAATLVHNYTLRPYTIPTGSLEKTLLIGDYLFVSKYHYGARVPKTPLAFPMVHDTMPIPTKFRSYVKGVELPYMRLPGIQSKIERNDIVVFNWPTDTVFMFRDSKHRYVNKPLDKKSNYVKRCVGIAGDSLEIRDGYIFINGKQTVLPDRAKPQYRHIVEANNKVNFNRFFKKHYKPDVAVKLNNGKFLINLILAAAEDLRKVKGVKSVIQSIDTIGNYNKDIFPHDQQYPWTKDNFGPIYIPKKGDVVDLNPKTISFYKRIINIYEDNNLTIDGDKYIINGVEATTYTIKQDYYWMMGDNRHNSEDARYWGFVPFDHVVGKPLFIFFSRDLSKSFFSSIRWDRMFTSVHKQGKPKSYLWYVVGGIALIWGGTYIRRKRKENN